ncbi:MAG TPA: glutamate formimidoyltransferase [Armatimonadetes bacterium]|nr:glutamate formimidoyltransferase [Armatimonadota bacterium]
MSLEVVWSPINFSEGRREEVIEEIAGAAGKVRGVRVGAVDPDPDHNRTVVALLGPPEAIAEAAFEVARKSVELINIFEHQGEHPRIGAVDVIPFVPARGVDMGRCKELAVKVGRRLAEELELPVFFYAESATSPERRNLADIRKGGLKALAMEIATTRRPDLGPTRLHPTAGAVVVGARRPLASFNVNLGTGDIEVARRIARAIRERTGGLVGVRALGVNLRSRGIVQVTTTIADPEITPLHRVFELVRMEAERYGVPVVGSEIIGVAPASWFVEAAAHYLRLENMQEERLIEWHLLDMMERGELGG